MENLKLNSINVTKPTTVCWPQHNGEQGTLDMSEIRSKFNGCYATNNSTICFVIDEEVFVTPYTREAMTVIKNAGLVERCFYVPFSNGDYPRVENLKWLLLRTRAAESYFRDYETDAIAWCDEHGVGELSAETMKRCFRIPREGVEVKHSLCKYTYTNYPILNERSFDYVATKTIGHYCRNNGRVVFVYRDGHTYVARGYKIIDELSSAGYASASLFVPFSNGEVITHPTLAAEWERICSEK